jgi:membrane dipeptidase
MRLTPIAAFALALAAPAASQETVSAADRLFHEQLLTLDTHLDTPAIFERRGWDFDQWHNVEWDGSQVDIPRMQAGGLDGGFFVIYTAHGDLTPQGYARARDTALLRAMAIQRVVAANGNRLEFAYTADDAARIQRSGKRAVYQATTSPCSRPSTAWACGWQGRFITAPTNSPTAPATSRAGTASARSGGNGSPR